MSVSWPDPRITWPTGRTSWDDQVAAMVAGPVYASEAQIQAVQEILIEAGALPRGVASHGKPISDFARRIVEAVLGAR